MNWMNSRLRARVAVRAPTSHSAATHRLRLVGAGLVVVALLALVGCGSIEVALGMRTRLDKVPVTALSASLSPEPGLSPGKSGRLVITATSTDGKQWVTVGPGHGKVLFDSFTFDAAGVTVNKKGVVSLPADPRISETVMPHVRITAIGHADISADLDIPVRYDVAFVAHFSGSAGSKGFDGSNGLDGSSGSNGSIDWTNPSAGGNGTDGSNGGDGDNGQPGQSGENVHVWVTLKSGVHPLLQVRAASSRHEQLFLVSPDGGTLTVDANGGAGGAGGSGGRGGRGGSGGTGFPPGLSGHDGLNGWDGHSGADGAAGTITVSIDPQAQGFADRLHFSNRNGNGAPGPTPIVRIEAVPPIW
jgi:hypothetical protein